LVVILAAGCGSLEREAAVAVGMPFSTAQPILAAAGAQPVVLQTAGAGPGWRNHGFVLSGGDLLTVTVSGPASRISALSLCAQPNSMGGKRLGTWREVRHITLKK